MYKGVVVAVYDIGRNIFFFKDDEARVAVEVDAKSFFAEEVAELGRVDRSFNMQIIMPLSAYPKVGIAIELFLFGIVSLGA